MADDERKALVVQGSRSLAEVGAGARKILSSVVSDALTVAYLRKKVLTSTVFRIGSFEFREPDYGQILTWANRLDIDSETLVQRLSAYSFTDRARDWEKTIFKVERGTIFSLAWDISELGFKELDWLPELSIQTLAVFDALGETKRQSRPFDAQTEQRNLSFSLQCLGKLFIGPINLAKVALSKVPTLEILVCERNGLSELDLSGSRNLPSYGATTTSFLHSTYRSYQN